MLGNMLDCDTYEELRESVGWKVFSREQNEYGLAHDLYHVVVKDGRKNIAMGRLIGDGVYFMIVDLAVRPEYQGKGIGTRILDEILKYIKGSLPEGARASVQLIAEKGKENFYIKSGFKTIPHENCGSGMRKVIHT